MKEGREPELLRVDTEPDPLSAQMGHVGRRGPAARSGSGIQAEGAGSARRLAWLLGFCLPLSGGFPLSNWIPGYPNQVTVIRLVTFASLVWLVRSPQRKPLPRSSRGMIQILLAVFAYAMLSLLWAPDVTEVSARSSPSGWRWPRGWSSTRASVSQQGSCSTQGQWLLVNRQRAG